MNSWLKCCHLWAALKSNGVVVSMLVGVALMFAPVASGIVYPPYGPIECFETCEREAQAVHQACINEHRRRGAGHLRVYLSCTLPYNRAKKQCELKCGQLPWPVYPGY